jgi:hypothetical protein
MHVIENYIFQNINSFESVLGWDVLDTSIDYFDRQNIDIR